MDAQTAPAGERGLGEGIASIRSWAARQGLREIRIEPLKRRYWGGVFSVASGPDRWVVKTGGAAFDADCEAAMLDDLASAGLRVPATVHREQGMLMLEALNWRSLTPAVAEEAGRALARMHLEATADAFGYGRPTTFGTLPLDNGWLDGWAEFFIERRLRPYLRLAGSKVDFGVELSGQIERAIDRMRTAIDCACPPALLHGDIWANNAGSVDGSPAFLDPSALYGDPDYEVAFFCRYLDFRTQALRGYRQIRPLARDFWTLRFPAYSMCFDLAHVALFGGAFIPHVRRALAKMERQL